MYDDPIIPENDALVMDYHLFLHDHAVCGWEPGEPDDSAELRYCPDCDRLITQHVAQHQHMRFEDWYTNTERVQRSADMRRSNSVDYAIKAERIWLKRDYLVDKMYYGTPYRVPVDPDLLQEYARAARMLEGLAGGDVEVSVHTKG